MMVLSIIINQWGGQDDVEPKRNPILGPARFVGLKIKFQNLKGLKNHQKNRI